MKIQIFSLLFLFYFSISAADFTATLDSSDGSSSFMVRDSSSSPMFMIDSDGNAVFKGGIRIDSAGVKNTTSELLIVDGKIGINTVDPLQQLGVNGYICVDQSGSDAGGTGGGVYHGINFGSYQGESIGSKQTAGGNQHGLDFYTAWNPRLSITNSGDVGIGTTSPTARLDVNGIMRSNAVYAYGSDHNQRSTTSTAHIFEDNLSCTISVKSGDLIYAAINGNIWCSPAASNAWIRVEQSSGAAATIIMDSDYAGNGTGNYVGVTTAAFYRADADGTITFKMKWHTNSGTAYCVYRTIFAWVLGKA